MIQAIFANNSHVKFQQVKKHKMQYIAARKNDKPYVARAVVQMWKNQSPPGRFLMKSSTSDNETSDIWYIIDDNEARKKVSQCLRERTPEIISSMQKLENRCNISKEEKSKEDDSLNENLHTVLDDDDVDDSKSSSEHAPTESSLNLNDRLQMWKFLQCQNINMVS